MSQQAGQARSRIRPAATKLAILLALFVWAFWPELSVIALGAMRSSEQVHALLAPIMILWLVWHRRVALAEALSAGSPLGLVLISVGLFLYAIATWPFNYGYVRDLAMIPVLAGLVLLVCGWRVLKLSLPMLLLVILAIPVGSRIYARLIIRPETYTIQAVAAALGLMPGVDAIVKGLDIFFTSDAGAGVVALGESNRGARLLLAFAAIGVFVVFSRIRSFGRLVFLASAAIPAVLVCNFFRLLCWAIMAVYAARDPAACTPRNVSTVLSMLLAYVLFELAGSLRLNLFVEADQTTVQNRRIDHE